MTKPAKNPAARWPAAVKVAGAIGLVLAITLTPAPRPAWFGVEAAVLCLVLIAGRVSPVVVLRRLAWLSPFVAGAALAAAWSPHGTDWRILALRSGLCLATVIILARTTTFGDLLGVLRQARVPALLITTLALMHRYLFVLRDESGRMGRARSARTFTRGRRFAWLAAASVVGQLFVRASARAERIYDAMCARGWTS